MSHMPPTAHLSISLMEDGRLAVHCGGDLDALMGYLEEAMQIVAEKRQAKEAAPCL